MADEPLTVVKSEPLPTLTVADAPETSVGSDSPNSSSGLALASVGKLTPAAAWQLMRFGTSPTAAATGGTVARVGTTVAAAGHGLATGNIPEVIAAPAAGWAAGKGGYFGTKMLQAPARLAANVLDKAAPIADAVAKVGGVQGALDLAQMAEPSRQDIGFLGIGKSTDNMPTPQAIKAMESSGVNAVKFLVAKGIAPAEAMKQVTGGNPALIGPLMMAYMKAQQVK